MEVRTAQHGRQCLTFKTEGRYYTPADAPKEEIFEGFRNAACCVVATKVVHDKGTRIISRYGVPSSEYYDNGLVGYQGFDFYDTLEEGRQHLKWKQQVGNKTYVDIFLVINK